MCWIMIGVVEYLPYPVGDERVDHIADGMNRPSKLCPKGIRGWDCVKGNCGHGGVLESTPILLPATP
jgi:hypothetical protein